jgi:hypothetical protein
MQLSLILQTKGFSLIQRRRAVLDGNVSERLYSRLAGSVCQLDRIERNLFPPEKKWGHHGHHTIIPREAAITPFRQCQFVSSQGPRRSAGACGEGRLLCR